MPFVTDLESRAASKGSGDPLGAQAIWTLLGRHVVGVLTTNTTSVRDLLGRETMGGWIVELVGRRESRIGPTNGDENALGAAARALGVRRKRRPPAPESHDSTGTRAEGSGPVFAREAPFGLAPGRSRCACTRSARESGPSRWDVAGRTGPASRALRERSPQQICLRAVGSQP